MSTDVSRRRDKQSLGYVARSGLAGGLAGCVVCARITVFETVHLTFRSARQKLQLHRLTE